jgi:hypothetical protein
MFDLVVKCAETFCPKDLSACAKKQLDKADFMNLKSHKPKRRAV